MTQRAVLSEGDREKLMTKMQDWREAERLQAEVRAMCVESVARSSYREVSLLTGFSTNTLQRWKREAGK